MKITQAPHPTSATAKLPADLAAEKQHAALRTQAQRLASQTFFGAMLKQMRQSPFKSKIFDGGRGGEVFSSMLDQHLAQRMATGVGNKLVDSIVHKLEQNLNEKSKPGSAKQPTPRSLFKKSGYSTQPAATRRPYVPTDFRA